MSTEMRFSPREQVKVSTDKQRDAGLTSGTAAGEYILISTEMQDSRQEQLQVSMISTEMRYSPQEQVKMSILIIYIFRVPETDEQ